MKTYFQKVLHSPIFTILFLFTCCLQAIGNTTETSGSYTLGFVILEEGPYHNIAKTGNLHINHGKAVVKPIEAPMDLALIEGDLKRFHKLTFTWNGPNLTESENTYRDYRLNVTFISPTGKTYVVPGYFAADGNAGETSADSGNKWRCHFTTLELGNWTYSASFRTGTNIAVSLDENVGSSLSPIDGDQGTFTITETDKTGIDFRAKGKLEYVGEHFMQWTNGDYFMKIGSNSPENFFEYQGFDNTNSARTYPDHITDWNTGDPTWKNQDGKGIIGAVNYLSSKGINGQYFVVQRSGEIASPWVDPSSSYYSYDVSKLDQWQVVLDHMMRKGLMAHFVFSESTNQSFFEFSVPSGDPNFSDARKLYFRELIARFGYLNAVTWNIGEENGWKRNNGVGDALTTQQQLDFTAYLDSLAYYNDFITVHNGPAGDTHIYDLLQGDNSITGTSMQGVHRDNNRSKRSTEQYRRESANSGRKWVMYYDEAWIGGSTDTPTFRKNVLWPTLTSGGAGIEHYATNGLDVSLQDMRFYDEFYSQMKHAYDLYHDNDIPFYNMYNQDELVTNGWCHGDDFNNYVIYVQAGEGGTTTIDLLGSYSVQWYDPRNGGALQEGTITEIVAGNDVNIGLPPSDIGSDWVAVIRDNSTGPVVVSGVLLTPEILEIGEGYSSTLKAQVIPGNAQERGIIWSSDDTSIVTVDSNGNILGTGIGTTVVRATTVDGGFSAVSNITVVDSSDFCLGSGTVRMDSYNNISGVSLDNLFSAPDYPNNPSSMVELNSFEIPSNVNDNYGVRVSGYLCAPESGTYTFWIAGDDHVQLNLSMDDQPVNVVNIAYHTNYTAPRQWDKFSTQKSTEIQLQQGSRYYIEAFMKEGGGGDNLAVGWRKPSDGNGSAPIEIIPGSVLSPDDTIEVRGIELNVNNANLEVTETLVIQANILPSDASNRSVVWSSSNSLIATVDSFGNVQGISAGTAVISATTLDGGHTAQATINVVVPVTEVELDPVSTNLELGTSLTLNATVLPANASNKLVTWESNDASIVSVDTDGNVMGQNVGTAIIEVRTDDGGYVAEAVINVIVSVAGIQLDDSEMELDLGGTLVLVPSILPSNATDSSVVWSSGDDSIVTVDQDGNIHGESVGTAVISATTVDGGFVAQTTVNVLDNSVVSVTGVSLDASSTDLELSSIAKLNATVFPENATSKELVWSSEDDSIVTVDQDGNIHGESVGITVISVTTVDGGFVAQTTVNVLDNSIVSVTGISLDVSYNDLAISSVMQLHATVFPENATDPSVVWSSEDDSVVTVDQNGNVYGESVGTAFISATTVDGGFVAQTSVNVSDNSSVDVTGISLDVSTLNVELSSTTKVNATVFPENATDASVVWSSDDDSIVSVDQDGNILGESLGTTVVSATTVDGSYSSQATITVISNATSPPFTLEISASVVDVETGLELFELTDGIEIDYSTISGKNLTILAYTNSPEVESIDFSLSGPVSRTGSEYEPPYSLFGVDTTSKGLLGKPFDAGTFNLNITANKKGALEPGESWQPFDISFSIKGETGDDGSDSTNSEGDPDILLYPNPTTSYISVAGIDAETVFSIYDLNGQFLAKGTGDEPVYVGNLGSSIYLIRVGTGEKLRFIKN